MSEGATLIDLRRVGPKKVLFSFVACQELHALLRVYWSKYPVLVVPSLLFDTLHKLKCLSITRL